MKIATHIAELENVESMYQGVLGIGAALLAKDPKQPKSHQNNPKIPILYLMNASELGPIESYISACKKNMKSDDRIIAPGINIRIARNSNEALWEISREGHNWVNEEERLDAIQNLVEWIHYKTFITRRNWNNTVFKAPKSTVEWVLNSSGKIIGAKAIVTSTNVHGSLRTNLVVEDLLKMNIRHNGKFAIGMKENKEENVIFGFYPFVGIPENSWICFEDPDGFIMFSILTFRYKNSLQELGLQVNDSLYIHL